MKMLDSKIVCKVFGKFINKNILEIYEVIHLKAEIMISLISGQNVMKSNVISIF